MIHIFRSIIRDILKNFEKLGADIKNIISLRIFDISSNKIFNIGTSIVGDNSCILNCKKIQFIY